MTKTFLIGAAAAAFLTGSATAQPQGQRGPGPALDRAQVQAQVAERFARVDANRDGFVTREEAEAARAAVRARTQERRGERRAAMFTRLDADGNGAISREEFTRPQPRAEGPRGERRAERGEHRGGRFAMRRHRMGGGMAGQGFARLDSNGDGRVSLAEATAVRLERFDRADSNRDGRISRGEIQAVRAERPAR